MDNFVANGKKYIKLTADMAMLVDKIFMFCPVDNSMADSAELLMNTLISTSTKDDEVAADFYVFSSRAVVGDESFFGVGEHEAKQISAIRDLFDMILSEYAENP